MANLGNLTVGVTMDTAQFRTGAEAIEHKLKSLKQAAGTKALKGVSEVLLGGGAVAGFSIAGHAINSATQAIRDQVTDLRLGRKTWQEAREEVMQAIPVFGQFYAAGRNIREVFMGERAELQKLNDEIEASTNNYISAMNARSRLAGAYGNNILKKQIDSQVEYVKALEEIEKRENDLLKKKGLSPRGTRYETLITGDDMAHGGPYRVSGGNVDRGFLTKKSAEKYRAEIQQQQQAAEQQFEEERKNLERIYESRLNVQVQSGGHTVWVKLDDESLRKLGKEIAQVTGMQ